MIIDLDKFGFADAFNSYSLETVLRWSGQRPLLLVRPLCRQRDRRLERQTAMSNTSASLSANLFFRRRKNHVTRHVLTPIGGNARSRSKMARL